MSDGPLPQTAPATTQADSSPPAGERPGEGAPPKWGDPISSIPTERQEQLRNLAEAQRAWVAATGPDRDPTTSPFAKGTDFMHPLTGAEVFFLAAEAFTAEQGMVLIEAETLARGGRYVSLAALHLEGAFLREARLESSNLSGAHLEGARLHGAHLARANLHAIHLRDADLYQAHLEHSLLNQAHLEGASLVLAHLEHANLTNAHLEGASLYQAHLGGADLRGMFLSTATNLARATIAHQRHGAVLVADVRWQDANLAVITQWGEVALLGDEQWARKLAKQPLPHPNKPWVPLPKRARLAERRESRAIRREEMLEAWREAARANRQLASVMRDQGMNDEADRFAYRGQLCQRQVYRYSRQRGRRLGSWLLDVTSGYGYHPRRSAYTYIGVVLAFAVAFFLLRASVSPALDPLDALVFSVTSFHGRGFSPGEAVTLHNPLTVLAAGEAILGLLIEITFIATFTQRFFGR